MILDSSEVFVKSQAWSSSKSYKIAILDSWASQLIILISRKIWVVGKFSTFPHREVVERTTQHPMGPLLHEKPMSPPLRRGKKAMAAAACLLPHRRLLAPSASCIIPYLFRFMAIHGPVVLENHKSPVRTYCGSSYYYNCIQYSKSKKSFKDPIVKVPCQTMFDNSNFN